MKIGFIADIHSNVYGLNSVLKELKKVDIIFCVGDIIGYYTFVNEVFDEIRKRNIHSILGNHDIYLLGKSPASLNSITRTSLEYTRKNISKENLNYLKKIGKGSLNIEIDGLKIKMYHGSPWNEFEEYIYPDFQDFDKFQKIDADLIVLGHTHWPMLKKIGKTIILNPGSCGQPRDYNPKASFAIFNTKTKNIQIKRVSYKIDKVCQAIREASLDKELIKILKRTK